MTELTCAQFIELVTAQRDGELPSAVADRYQQHRHQCVACDRYVDQITATIALLAHFSVDTVLPHWDTLTGHAAVLEGPSHSEVSDARRQDFQ